jgi:hypothetical protein
MKKTLYISILVILLTVGCGQKEESASSAQQGEIKSQDKTMSVEADPLKKSKQQVTYAANENIYPKLAASRVDDLFARGLPTIQANKFHNTTKVINKFADISQAMEADQVDMDKIVWELNTIVQKNGFADLAAFVEDFTVLAEAHGTYQQLKMMDAMIAGGADEKRVELYEEKIKQSFADQQLSREDLRFIHNNKEKFARTLEVMEKLARQSMEAGF